MTDYDARLQYALAVLAAGVDETPAWDDVVGRAEPRPRFRWKAAALALALLVTSGVVAGAFAQDFLSDSLDRLSSWAGEQPGYPDPEQQAAFDRENAAAYARFPSGTRIGRLLSTEVGGLRYELFGFRSGTTLCLRLVPFPVPPNRAIPECVPQSELARFGKPIAPIGGHVGTRLPDGSGLTMLYGLSSDAVSTVEVLADGRPVGSALVGNNAFLYARLGRPGSPIEGPALTVRARDAHDSAVDVPLEIGPSIPRVNPVALPGPDQVERTLTAGSIGWLEGREPRGEPYAWPTGYPQDTIWSRQVQPDPANPLRIGLAFAEGTRPESRGRWYCLAWLWPLVDDSFGHFCGRSEAVASGMSYTGSVTSMAVQFPLTIGIVSDDVTRIEFVRTDGTRGSVALRDNVFALQTSRREPVKLVAYDREGRVVKVEVLGGPGSSLRSRLLRP